jgi:PhnB protein
MALTYKPAGYNSVSVYIMANDAQRLIDFLGETLYAEKLRCYERADGTIMHAEVQIEDSVVMIAQATAEYPAFPVWLHVYLPDVDAAYQRMLSAGGESVDAPNQSQGDGDRRGGVKDPCGNVWWISTQMK